MLMRLNSGTYMISAVCVQLLMYASYKCPHALQDGRRFEVVVFFILLFHEPSKALFSVVVCSVVASSSTCGAQFRHARNT